MRCWSAGGRALKTDLGLAVFVRLWLGADRGPASDCDFIRFIVCSVFVLTGHLWRHDLFGFARNGIEVLRKEGVGPDAEHERRDLRVNRASKADHRLVK